MTTDPVVTAVSNGAPRGDAETASTRPTLPRAAHTDPSAVHPAAVTPREPHARVVGLAGLARHFEQGEHPADQADPSIRDTSSAQFRASAATTTAVLAETTTHDRPSTDGVRSPRRAHRADTADPGFGRPGEYAATDLPAADLLIARRLTDIVGEVVAADARRQGIDLDGIHLP